MSLILSVDNTATNIRFGIPLNYWNIRSNIVTVTRCWGYVQFIFDFKNDVYKNHVTNIIVK